MTSKGNHDSTDMLEALTQQAWSEYQAEHGYTTYPTQPDTGADFAAGFERGVAAVQKVYLVLWDGAYMEDGNGISGAYLSQEAAQAEADRLTAVEDEDRKKRRYPYTSIYYSVEEMELKA